jgi:putative FmdB family regulatory protein
MPLYEYQCDACGRRFELIRKFSDPPLEECPSCGGAVQKLVSSPAFQFKGTGFYITDYGKKEQPSSSQSDEAKADAAASKDKAEKTDDKGGDKSGKGDKPDSSEKSTKGTAASESASTSKAPAPSTKEAKSST